MRVGILFPGQGTQHVGMGKKWYEADRKVQEYFEHANSCLGVNVAKLCFASHANELKKTINAQISIFVVSCALYEALKNNIGIEPSLFAGHSSGEYAAVHAAKGMSFADALYLVNRRAHLMEAATQSHPGIMLAVLGLEPKAVHALCASAHDGRSIKRIAQVACYNGPEQTIVSCSPPQLRILSRGIKAAGGRFMRLPVSGGFHSQLMNDAQKDLNRALSKVTIHDLAVPVVANVTALPIQKASEIQDELQAQLCSPVRWWDSMKQFAFCDVIIQVGPGTTFAKLLRRHWPEKRVFSFNEQADLDPILRAVQTWEPGIATQV